jgi:gamma-glutamyltranspeptidase/glutathione hydrolase
MRWWLAGAALLAAAAGPLPGDGTEPAMARHHMAATANRLASDAAVSVLRDHGSAVDAAIAAQMVLGVVEPQASGLGGGGIMLSWTQANRTLTSFEGLSASPAELSGATTRGGASVGVPGVLRMLALAHDRAGRLDWPRLLRDAIGLAETGFPMPPYLHQVLLRQPGLAEIPGFALYFDPAHRPLPEGALVRNPALGEVMRRIAEVGPDAFYTGPIADRLVQAVGAAIPPGRISRQDLASYQARERPPLCGSALGHLICTAPPPSSGGMALLQQLRLLDRLGIDTTQPGSVAAVHLFLEAGRLSLADRKAWVGDPDQVAVPTGGLLAQAYIDQRAELVDPRHAMQLVTAGLPAPLLSAAPVGEAIALPHTSHLAIVDDDGDAVSFTTTVNLDFGAWIVADGVVLNDGLSNFAVPTKQGSERPANAIAPRKRPATTISPTIVFDSKRQPEIVLGAGGGARIIDSVAETLIGMLAWHQDIRRAISQPRYGAQNGRQELEAGTQVTLLAADLRAMGHAVEIDAMNAAVQGIVVTPQGLAGWGDRHRDGVAVGD